MKKMLKTLFWLLVILLAAGGTLYFLAQPSKELSMKHDEFKINEKLKQSMAVKDGQIAIEKISLSETDVANILKEKLSGNAAIPGIEIAGLDVSIAKDKFAVEAKAKKGALTFGVTAKGGATYENGKIKVSLNEFALGKIPLSYETVSSLAGGALKNPIEVDVKSKLTPEFSLTGISLEDKAITVSLDAKVLKVNMKDLGLQLPDNAPLDAKSLAKALPKMIEKLDPAALEKVDPALIESMGKEVLAEMDAASLKKINPKILEKIDPELLKKIK